MDPVFLEKINPTFLGLTAAILCHALHCWQTGLLIDEVHFTHSNLPGKPLLISVRGGNPLIG